MIGAGIAGLGRSPTIKDLKKNNMAVKKCETLQ
jgi:hypothetical protein